MQGAYKYNIIYKNFILGLYLKITNNINFKIIKSNFFLNL